ncbi:MULTISPECIES: CDP-alcohol phosphatidyltransferase family protein [Campylobacter]|jgi:putative membrane protein|uniref:CDP-alcohol phosphatidyltransferase family protein n=1 Tax=Campylobacter TaxID=194 RepID=UPI00027A3981|nr:MULTISPECIES: CDP-alcohol phosphatidyltransferase family protein [Campylobacter]EJP74461.1 CDP-alcohol phosphatidyltransferase [Campylobacter sp. FOBRC14]QKF61467.1 CDP-OH_P_transf domain-containing protein [Campylobacter curvus]UEB49775.1 CDP-alcohol phosphatidyltransferase family protein [Campylobacter curvus]
MQKPKRRKFRQETVIHSYIVRPLAQEFVMAIWNTNITPNQVTLFRSIIAVFYLLLFMYGSAISFIVAIVLFEIAEILDHADGMLARLKNQCSKLGQYYEYITDELFAAEYGPLGFSVAYGAFVFSSDVIFIYLSMACIMLYYFVEYFRKIANSVDKKMGGGTKVVTTVEHDHEDMLRIIGVPLKQGIVNLIKTIYIWRNQLLFLGLFYLIFFGKFLLILVFCIYIISYLREIFKALRSGYLIWSKI